MNRFKDSEPVDPTELISENKADIPEYQVDVPHKRLPIWLTSIISILVVVAIIVGVLWGAKWLYDSMTADHSNKAPVKPTAQATDQQKTNTQAGTEPAKATTTPVATPTPTAPTTKPAVKQLPNTGDDSADPADFGY